MVVKGEISLKQKMIVSLVAIAPGVINYLIVNSLLIYYTDKLGLDKVVLYGVAILIYGIWDAINNPIIGVYIENWQPSSGKEKLKSLMKIGLPIMFFGFLLFTLAPKGSPDWLLFAFLLSGLIIFELGKAIVEVASITFSLMIVTEPEQRSNLILIMKILEFIPLALIGMVPVIFLAPERPYWQSLIFILMVCTIMFAMSYRAIFIIEEPDDLFQSLEPQHNTEHDSLTQEQPPQNTQSSLEEPSNIARSRLKFLIASIRTTLSSKPFVMLVLFRLFGALFQAAFSANIIFMINWVVPISTDFQKLFILGAGGVIINLYYILQTHMVQKMPMVKVIYISFFVSFIGYILLFFANGFMSLLISYCLSNMGLAAIYMFSNVMIGDVGDNNLVETGKHRYSEFTANFSVFNSLAPAIVSFIITFILQISRYDGGSQTGQLDSAILGIRIIASTLPIIGLIICTIILKYYPLQGEKYNKMRIRYNEIKKS